MMLPDVATMVDICRVRFLLTVRCVIPAEYQIREQVCTVELSVRSRSYQYSYGSHVGKPTVYLVTFVTLSHREHYATGERLSGAW